MKISTERWGEKREYNSLEEYAEYRLDGDDHGKGQMEAATDTARNNSKAIGRLLDLLATKNLVTAEEVATIIDGYFSGSACFQAVDHDV